MSAVASAPPDATAVQRIGLKVFLDDGAVLSPRDVIPVFHRWIQTRAVDGMLIDVADYAHLPTGPLVLLVAHEGRYVLDRGDDRLGLQYVRTQPLDGRLETRLRTVAGMLVRAARLLESDATLPGPVRFRGRRDRLGRERPAPGPEHAGNPVGGPARVRVVPRDAVGRRPLDPHPPHRNGNAPRHPCAHRRRGAPRGPRGTPEPGDRLLNGPRPGRRRHPIPRCHLSERSRCRGRRAARTDISIANTAMARY